MSFEKKLKTYKNPDLSITKYNLAAWAIPGKSPSWLS